MSKNQSKKHLQHSRKLPRIDIRRQFTIEYNGETETVISANFGFGGALIETSFTLPIGANIKITLNDRSGTASAIAEVIREHDAKYAIKILEKNELFTAIMIDIVSPHLPVDAWDK